MAEKSSRIDDSWFLHIEFELKKKKAFICFLSYLKYISIYNFLTFIKRVDVREMVAKKNRRRLCEDQRHRGSGGDS